MQNPQVLRFRTADVFARDPEQLSAVQTERRREYVQIAAGAFHGALCERSSGEISFLYERWNCGMRVRCARPSSFVALSAVISESSSSWCAVELQPCSVLELAHDWEITTRGSLESFSFAVERTRLEAIETGLAGGSLESPRNGNRVLTTAASSSTVALLRARIQCALSLGALPPEAQRALEDDLTHFAARLRRWGTVEDAKPESESRRRLAVRRVEEYLDAHASDVPPVATLCSIARVSERTLEYAFLEQLGVSPTRYLRLRRLNAVRRELLHGEPEKVRVTDSAMRWGFWELGRFAREYRSLFGELPSQTLVGRGATISEASP